MIILPAIDLKDGLCVRLRKGDFSTAEQVSQDPVETARAFEEAGAQMIHVVDLDGALAGRRYNSEIVTKITKSVDCGIELGGGIRNMKDLKAVERMGVRRMVIGSAAVSDPDFVKAAVKAYGDRIAVGVDASNGQVRTHGWQHSSGEFAAAFAVKMENLGVKTIIYTDIDTDGMLRGPSIDQLIELREALSCQLIASGGVTNLEDIQQLRDIGLDGVIIGKACYAGTINLREAIREAAI